MPLLRSFRLNLFRRPYRNLPSVVFAFFALSFTLHPESPLRTHELFDPDDYMRLVEVMNWLQSAHPFGAGWYDLSQPRLSPGDHVIVHWSRLVDLPIAFFALPFIPVVGMQNAVLIGSFIVPPLLFGFVLVLAPALARPLVGRRRANLAAAMLLFAQPVLLNFSPGRADHHGYQIIIAAYGLACLARMILCPRGWKSAIAAAAAFACGLWIGTEALPWLILSVACLCLFASLRGGYALRSAGVFGLALPLAVAGVMPLALPPDQYASRALSWFSGADLIFAVLAGSVLVLGWIGGRTTSNVWLRVVLMSTLGFSASLLFVYFVPDTLTGNIYADGDEFFNNTLIVNTEEALPAIKSFVPIRNVPEAFLFDALLFLRQLFLPCLATAIVAWNFIRARSRARMLWFMHGLFLVPALLLTLFWQVRMAWFMQMFSIVPATWLVVHCSDRLAARSGGRERLPEIAVLFLVALLPVVLLPTVLGNGALYPDLMLFPAARTVPECPLLRASKFLNDRYGDRPRVILSTAAEGPELLFRTRHSVLAAPYSANSNQDAFNFFTAPNEEQAMEVALRRGVDLVLICPSGGYDQALPQRGRRSLLERIANGDVPGWLTPITIPVDMTDYFSPNFTEDPLLFEVKK